MGQQQLLLVILVTIIVGIATVVAINTFGTAADSANVDAVRQDVAQIAASAQGFYLKPTMLGGGGKTFTDINFYDFAFPADSISSDSLSAINQNGLYIISNRGSNSFDITAHPSSDENYDASAGFSATATNNLSATITQDNMSYN